MAEPLEEEQLAPKKEPVKRELPDLEEMMAAGCRT
jgi:hypothetical protein